MCAGKGAEKRRVIEGKEVRGREEEVVGNVAMKCRHGMCRHVGGGKEGGSKGDVLCRNKRGQGMLWKRRHHHATQPWQGHMGS